ncbi:MAG: type II toxin-antitoxin system mRNA interferase toxin, RelE/StbE family [bacterium]|nr:type II toxin-antitoxin system mRNA interferase toxin, RelE/StbE family [bacterium]
MEIEYSPKFFRQFKKLPREAKEQAVICEKLFRKNPFDSRLKTHKLHGTMREYWAFSISYSYRIGFTFIDRDLVRFHSVGTHNIYK